MAATFVQQTAAQSGSGSAAFPGSVTAGNLIVVSGGVSGATDNLGNTYHLAVTSASFGQPVAIYYAYNVTGGSVTVSPTLVGHQQWVAEEWSGFGGADPLGGTGTNAGPNVTPITASPAAGGDGCAIVAISCFNGFGSPSSASGTNPATWTNRMAFGFVGTFSASGAHSSGTVEASITYGGGAVNVDAVIAYFAASISGSSDIVIDGPSISGTGSVTPPAVTGSGGVVIGGPAFSTGLTNLTQVARTVVTSEDATPAHLTQMARQVATTVINPNIYLTQMARQVMYSYTCESEPEPPPITDGPIVHVIIRPQWELERLDVKIRPEERGAKRR